MKITLQHEVKIYSFYILIRIPLIKDVKYKHCL